MEASRKKQSRVRGRSYVSPERTNPAKVYVKSVAIRARFNIANDATLDLLKCKLRNRVVFGGQDKLRHTPHRSSSKAFCELHRWKYGSDNKKSKKKGQVVMCSDCMVHFCLSCFDLLHKHITVKELKLEVGKSDINNNNNKRKR